MKTDRNHQSRASDRRERATTPAAAPSTWTRPEFTEVLACAEIGAYAFRAS